MKGVVKGQARPLHSWGDLRDYFAFNFLCILILILTFVLEGRVVVYNVPSSQRSLCLKHVGALDTVEKVKTRGNLIETRGQGLGLGLGLGLVLGVVEVVRMN